MLQYAIRNTNSVLSCLNPDTPEDPFAGAYRLPLTVLFVCVSHRALRCYIACRLRNFHNFVLLKSSSRPYYLCHVSYSYAWLYLHYISFTFELPYLTVI